MKLSSWQVILATSLILVSALTYLLQEVIFQRPGDTFFYMLQDLAFVPVQALLVTLILYDLFRRREKAALQKKLNMVIGAFFSEVGTELLKSLSEFDSEHGANRNAMVIRLDWTGADFARAASFASTHDYAIDSKLSDLAALKDFLAEKRVFVLGLLENPNLLEHASFTDMLWAVMHLTEELAHRHELSALPEMDYDHLGHDIKRAYSRLLHEWLSYVRHLPGDYPFMFSLVVRPIPIDPEAKVEFGG